MSSTIVPQARDLVRVCVPVWEHGTDMDRLYVGQALHSLHSDQVPSVESVVGEVSVSV